MPTTVYVTATEPGAGKSVVALGVMAAAVRAGGRVAFFRPIVRHDADRDPSTQLMRTRFDLPGDAAAMVGLNRAEARELLAADRESELLARVLERFKAVEADADFVLVEGTSFRGFAPGHEFDLNADLAANLGAPVLVVLTAAGKEPADVRDGLRIALDQLADRGCEVLAAVVNQIPADWDDDTRDRLRTPTEESPPVWLLPAEPRLEHPTVGEIAAALGATPVVGVGEEDGAGGVDGTADRPVDRYLVAAMRVPNFLAHLSDDDLVLTPGDRDDILLATLAGAASRSGPTPGGVILTGGIEPAGPVRTLVEGLARVPVYAVGDDTFTAAMAVNAVPASLGPHSGRRTDAALELFDRHVDADALADRLRVTRSGRVTPLMFEYELLRRARADRKHVVLPEGAEPRVLRAAEAVLRRGVADLTLLGPPDRVREEIHRLGLAAELFADVPVVDPATSPLRAEFAAEYHRLREHRGVTEAAALDRLADVSYFGTMMVHLGRADGMVSGSVHTTAHTIRPAFEFVKTRPGVSVVSGVFFMCLADRVLVYGDCAVVPNPTAEQLAEIAVSGADTAAQFGIEPRVALLSYSTGSSGTGEDVDRVRAATDLARSKRPDLPIEGPIQYDAAVDAGVARTKLPDSAVAGRATVLIFPDLNTGNNTYKAVQRSANAVAVGPVLQGLNKPVNDLSRGCTVADILNTVAITAIQAQGAGEK